MSRVGAPELAAAAGSSGHLVSSSQLKRLRLGGLLQRPVQTHQSGRRGSVTLYPEEAVEQLVGVLEIRRDRRQKPFDAIRFLAWEKGLWVEHRQIRNTIARYLRQALRTTIGTQTITSDRKLAEIAETTAETDAQGDLMTGALQLAQRSEDLEYAADTLTAATATNPSDFLSLGYQQTNIAEVWAALGAPPMSQWPRIISRISQRRLEVGRLALELAKMLPSGAAAFSEDSDQALRTRAITAVTTIILAREHERTNR